MPHDFFNEWMDQTRPEASAQDLVVLTERATVDAAVESAIRQSALDHLAGLAILKRIGGYSEAEAFIRNKVPEYKKVMSGDLGEILTSEYIDQCTDFTVPVKRLRWKDDRNTTMRGNDVLAICQTKKHCRLLKAESKSRAKLQSSVVAEAVAGLAKPLCLPSV